MLRAIAHRIRNSPRALSVMFVVGAVAGAVMYDYRGQWRASLRADAGIAAPLPVYATSIVLGSGSNGTTLSVVAGNPNGVVSGFSGDTVWDTSTPAFWQNQFGTVWTTAGKQQLVNVSPSNNLGRIGWQGGSPSILNDWSPTGLGTNTTQKVAASDNQGTTITGICSTTTCGASRNFVDGDMLDICNGNSTQDAGAVALSNEDSRSLAADQITTPVTGVPGQGVEAQFSIPSAQCVTLRYTVIDPVNIPSTSRWVVNSATGVQTFRTITAAIGLALDYQNFTLSGTYDNFNLPNVDGADGGPQGYASTVSAASTGAVLPQSTIHIAASSPVFAGPGAGSLIPVVITDSNGAESVLCTGATATTLTGCIGGTGTLTTGNAVAGGICEGGGSCLFTDYSTLRLGTLTSSAVTFSGFNALSNSAQGGLGPVKFVVNYGPGNLIFENQNVGSTTTNQFVFPGAANVTIAPNASLILWHPITASGWSPLGTVPYVAGSGVSLVGNAFTLNVNGGTTQTATAGQAFTAMTSLGIMTSSVFVNAAGANATLAGSTLGVAAAPTFTATNAVTEALEAVGPAVTTSAGTSGGRTDNWQSGSTATGVDNTFVRSTTSSTGTVQVSGMDGPTAGFNPGLRKMICNYGTGPVQMLNSNANSSAGNKFFLPFTLSTNPTYSVPYGGCVEYVYDNNGVWMPAGAGVTSHNTSYGPAPTLSGCGGGSPAVVGTDSRGTVTEGTTATGCTVTFAAAWDTFADVPSCQVTWPGGTPVTATYTQARATLTVVNTSATGSVFVYDCGQTKN